MIFYICNLHICQKKNCCWTFKLSKQCVSDMRGIKYHLCANLLKNTKMVISSWYIHLNVWSKMIWYKHHWYADLLQNRVSQMARCAVAFHWCRAKSGFLKTGSKWNLEASSNCVNSKRMTRCTFWECKCKCSRHSDLGLSLTLITSLRGRMGWTYFFIQKISWAKKRPFKSQKKTSILNFVCGFGYFQHQFRIL